MKTLGEDAEPSDSIAIPYCKSTNFNLGHPKLDQVAIRVSLEKKDERVGEEPILCRGKICLFSKLGSLRLDIATSTDSNTADNADSDSKLTNKSCPNIKRGKCQEARSKSLMLSDTKQSSTNPTVEKPFKCNICVKAYTCVASLKRHSRIHIAKKRQSLSSKTEKSFECKLCGKLYLKQQFLNVHISKHSDVKPYVCEVCQKGFTQSSYLKLHVLIHTEEKPFKCKLCNKSFRQMGQLTVHTRTHTGDKPFKCKYCTKRYSQKAPFESHMMSHTGETPFHCTFCNKKFTQSGNLNAHIMTHTREKPYVCKICLKGFTQKGNLKSHVRFCQSQLSVNK